MAYLASTLISEYPILLLLGVPCAPAKRTLTRKCIDEMTLVMTPRLFHCLALCRQWRAALSLLSPTGRPMSSFVIPCHLDLVEGFLSKPGVCLCSGDSSAALGMTGIEFKVATGLAYLSMMI